MAVLLLPDILGLSAPTAVIAPPKPENGTTEQYEHAGIKGFQVLDSSVLSENTESLLCMPRSNALRHFKKYRTHGHFVSGRSCLYSDKDFRRLSLQRLLTVMNTAFAVSSAGIPASAAPAVLWTSGLARLTLSWFWLYSTATTSISTSASLGILATSTALRAG